MWAQKLVYCFKCLKSKSLPLAVPGNLKNFCQSCCDLSLSWKHGAKLTLVFRCPSQLLKAYTRCSLAHFSRMIKSPWQPEAVNSYSLHLENTRIITRHRKHPHKHTEIFLNVDISIIVSPRSTFNFSRSCSITYKKIILPLLLTAVKFFLTFLAF